MSDEQGTWWRMSEEGQTLLSYLRADLIEIRASQQRMSEDMSSLRAEIAALRGRAAAWGALAGGGITVAAALVLRGLGV